MGSPPGAANDISLLWRAASLKAILHRGVARSSRAQFFVCFIAPRSCQAVHERRITRRNKTKNRARLPLATPHCRLALKRLGSAVLDDSLEVTMIQFWRSAEYADFGSRKPDQ